MFARSAVWTGTHLVVFDGLTKRLKRYSLSTDTWETLPASPESNGNALGVWTGSSLVLVPGASIAVLDWNTLAWTAKASGKPNSFHGRSAHWIGDSALLFDPTSALPLLRVRPQNPLYLYVKP